MKLEHLFPAILILLYSGAGIVSLAKHDYPRAVYWLCALVMNASISFWMGKAHG